MPKPLSPENNVAFESNDDFRLKGIEGSPYAGANANHVLRTPEQQRKYDEVMARALGLPPRSK